MNLRIKGLSVVICVLALFGTLHAQQQTSNTGTDSVANEISLLRKSLQTLNLRLSDITDKLLATDAKQADSLSDQKRITTNLDLLGRAEDRAGILKRQLLDLIEKETAYRSRLAQIDEDMRPENIERVMSGIGTTRTAEIRDVRRRSLEIEKRGVEGLLSITIQSRPRLEEDVRQSESLVQKLRQRLMPLIEKEIEKINPDKD